MNHIINSENSDLLTDQNTSNTQTKVQVSNSQETASYKPASYWSNIMYGVSMLAFIMIPVVTPGMTVKNSVIGMYSLILGTYIAAILFYLIRTRKSNRQLRTGRIR